MTSVRGAAGARTRSCSVWLAWCAAWVLTFAPFLHVARFAAPLPGAVVDAGCGHETESAAHLEAVPCPPAHDGAACPLCRTFSRVRDALETPPAQPIACIPALPLHGPTADLTDGAPAPAAHAPRGPPATLS